MVMIMLHGDFLPRDLDFLEIRVFRRSGARVLLETAFGFSQLSARDSSIA